MENDLWRCSASRRGKSELRILSHLYEEGIEDTFPQCFASGKEQLNDLWQHLRSERNLFHLLFFPSVSHVLGERVDFLPFVWFDSLEMQTNQRDGWCRLAICLVCLCQRPVWIRNLLTNLSCINVRDSVSTNISIFKVIIFHMEFVFCTKKSLVWHGHFLPSRWALDSKQAVLAIFLWFLAR